MRQRLPRRMAWMPRFLPRMNKPLGQSDGNSGVDASERFLPRREFAPLGQSDGSERFLPRMAWIRVAAGQSNKPLGRESASNEEPTPVTAVTAAKDRELGARRRSKVSEPVSKGALSAAIADTRWVLSWKLVDWAKDVEACMVAKGNRDPDLETRLAETSGCVILPSFHLRAISLGAVKMWKLRRFRARCISARSRALGPSRNSTYSETLRSGLRPE